MKLIEKRIGTVVFSALLAFSVASVAEAAWIEWRIADGGNGHWYNAVNTPSGISWSEANVAAQAAFPGAHLATTTSAEENDFVFSLIDDPSFWISVGAVRDGPWLGGFQIAGAVEPGGGWNWVTGEPFAYTNWAIGQPDNSQGGLEDRLHYWSREPVQQASTWNDNTGSGGGSGMIQGYIIESPRPIPIPATLPLLASGLAGLGLIGWCTRKPA